MKIDSEIRSSILIVDDEVTNINMLVHMLWEDYTLYVAKDGPAAIEMAKIHNPNLILLDIIMPGMNGYQVLEELRNSDNTKNIPIIFITGLSSSEDEEKGLSMEVADYISKPFAPSIVKLRIQNQMKLINYLQIIERMSMTDALTGLHNRRSFNERLRQEWGRAIREGASLGLIMLDVDNFKDYNDTYGHQQGDIVLQSVARVFFDVLKRSTDFVARWGGEEFIVLLPGSDIEAATLIAESIRVAVENADVNMKDGSVTRVTVSAGVNELAPSRDSIIDKFISDADKAMYIAKGQGRNRVVSVREVLIRR